MGMAPGWAGGHPLGDAAACCRCAVWRCGVHRMAIRPKKAANISVAGPPGPMLKLGGNLVLGLLGFDLDLAWLGLLGDRDVQRQDAAVVRSLHVLSIKCVPKD